MMFRNIYRNKKVLITGNSGFKGSWLTIWLIKLGADVYGISNGIPTVPSMFKELNLETKITYHQHDLRDLESISKKILDINPDFIFHLAAQSLVSVSYSNPIDTISTNVLGTANLLESVRLSNHRCTVIVITSDKCYDNVEWVWGYREIDHLGGKDIYGGSKGAAELIAKSYFHSFFKRQNSNIRIATARAGNVIGGGDWAMDRIVPDCIRAWNEKNEVKIRNPLATRPWQHVLEPLSGYLTLGQNLYLNPDLNGENFNFGPNFRNNYTVLEIIHELSKYWHWTDSDKAYSRIDNEEFHEAELLKLNCDKALSQLHWSPTLSFEKLVEFTGEWYLNYYNRSKNFYDFTFQQIEEYEKIASHLVFEWTK